MPILSSRAVASVKSFGFMVLTALKMVIDTFNRANTTSGLGSVKGQKWKIWRGGWRIDSNKAQITTAASNYPLATLTFTEDDVTVSIDGPDPGMGMSYWVSDEGNWWGSVYRQTYQCQTCFACQSYSCSQYSCGNLCLEYACSSYTYFCSSSNPFYTAPNYTCNITGGQNLKYNTPSCNITGGQNLRYSCSISRYTSKGAPRYTCNTFYTAPNYTCTSNAFYTAPNYTCSITGGQNLKYNCIMSTPACASNVCTSYQQLCGCTAYVCSQYFSFSCNCSTTYKIDIIQSISNSISQIATSNFNAAIASFKSILSGNNITVKAFSGSGYNSQIGSDWNAVNNVDSNTKRKRHGILGSQSNHAQGNNINEFRVDK